MDQQYSIDDSEQERHFIGNLLSDDEASGARSESSSRQSHKLSSLPSFENVTSGNANAIGPSPNQAFWPEPPPPYSPPLSDTFAKWELEAAATGDVFNTFGCGKDASLFQHGTGYSTASFNPACTTFTSDFVENMYTTLLKPFEGMSSKLPSKPPPPPSFNQIQQLNAGKKKGKGVLTKNMPPSDTELLKKKPEFQNDDLGDPDMFPSLYHQMSEHLPSAPMTPTGTLPGGKSYRDVLSTKTPQHKPISAVLSAPGPTPPSAQPTGTVNWSKLPYYQQPMPHQPAGPKVAHQPVRATSPPTVISPNLSGGKKQLHHQQNYPVGGQKGSSNFVASTKTGKGATTAIGGGEMSHAQAVGGEVMGIEGQKIAVVGPTIQAGEKISKPTAVAQRTIVGLKPIEGNKIDKQIAKEVHQTPTIEPTFQKLEKKKKGSAKHPTIPAAYVHPISPPQSPAAPSKKSILVALDQANTNKTSSKSRKNSSAGLKSGKGKDGAKNKKGQTIEELEMEANLKKVENEQLEAEDESYEIPTETSEDEADDDDETYFSQQSFRPKQKVRRGTDPEPKRMTSTEGARKRKNKQTQPAAIVYLTMFLTIVWEALVKFGTWIVNLIVDVVCLSYWAIVEAASTVAWKIVMVYRAVCHAISTFFKNVFLGTYNALKAGICLTTQCSFEDQFLVGLEENIALPTCCEEVLERLYTCHPIDAYSILGLKSDCSLEDIRRYYKRQAYLVRPERRLNFGVEQAYRLLTSAFELLKDPELRKEYDSELLNRVKLKNSELHSLLSDLHWTVDNTTHVLHCDCGIDHLVYRLADMKPLRYCKKCGERHLAKNNDIWVETRICGLFWTYYTCLNGLCFDITTWANCEHNHLKHIKPNSHVAYYRLQNVSLPPGHGDMKKHRCTQGFDDSPTYHANFQHYKSLVEREGGPNSNLSKTNFVCCCANSLLNTTENLESEIDDDKIPSVACCMGGTYIGVSTNASAFACSRSSVDMDPDRAKRAGRRRRIR